VDAASRAELDALRRRAFGPDSDIHGDAGAVARLIELEELARPRPAVEAPADSADGVSVPLAAPTAGTGVVPVAAAASSRAHGIGRAQRWLVTAGAASVVAVAVVAVLAQPMFGPAPQNAPTPTATAGEPAYIYTADPQSQTLLSIHLDGSFGGYIQIPAEVSPPAFPTTAELTWVRSLGDYYGWELWIAGGIGDAESEHCLALRRADETLARCADAEGQRGGALRVALSGREIAPDELPVPMTDDMRIRFWWQESGRLDVVLGWADR
jgi:hypothetical protein